MLNITVTHGSTHFHIIKWTSYSTSIIWSNIINNHLSVDVLYLNHNMQGVLLAINALGLVLLCSGEKWAAESG